MYYNRSLFLLHKKNKHALINQNYDIKSHTIMANKMKLWDTKTQDLAQWKLLDEKS